MHSLYALHVLHTCKYNTLNVTFLPKIFFDTFNSYQGLRDTISVNRDYKKPNIKVWVEKAMKTLQYIANTVQVSTLRYCQRGVKSPVYLHK